MKGMSGGGLAGLWGRKLLALDSKTDLENDSFAMSLPDTLLHPSLKQDVLSLPSHLVAGQNETYVVVLSNWLRETFSIVI